MNTLPPNSPKLFAPVNLARLLLVLLPGVPGLIFLAVGFVRDPFGLGRWLTLVRQSDQTRAALQAHGLYMAGAVTLLVGTLGMAAVVWKIVRTRPEETDTAQENDGT